MKAIREIERKYYKYLYSSWTQPTLSANGTMGDSSFAVSGSAYENNTTTYPAYGCFDKSSKEWWTTGTSWYKIYNPNPLCITNFKITYASNFGNYNMSIKSCNIKGSNDNINWTTIETFSGMSSSAGQTVNLAITNTNYYNYYLIDGITVVNGGNYNTRISEMVLTATQRTTTTGTSSDYDYYTDKPHYEVITDTYKYKAIKSYEKGQYYGN